MNWEAIGATGEVFGAVATLIMLVYLSIQVRHARDATQSASELESASLLTHLTQSISYDRNLIRIWDMVLQDSDELSEDDKLQYLWVISSFGHAAEGVFQQFKKGMISEELWSNWERGFTMHIGTPIGYKWWRSRAAPYSEPFFKHMNTIVESTKKPEALSSKSFFDEQSSSSDQRDNANDK